MSSTAFMTAKNRQNCVPQLGHEPPHRLAGNHIHGAHQERQVACGGLNQELLVNVLLAGYVQPVQSAGIKLMGEVPFDPLSPRCRCRLPCPRWRLNPPPVAIDRSLLRRLAEPVPRLPCPGSAM